MTGSLNIVGVSLRMTASLVPWDSAVFGRPVAAIDSIEIGDPQIAEREYAAFERWLDEENIHLVSCRLAHAKLRESMLLEAFGFRFVEMVVHPSIDDLARVNFNAHSDEGVTVSSAEASDVPILSEIAERAFRHERYYVDPRIDQRISGMRYRRWVENVTASSRQSLLKCMFGDCVASLFIVEEIVPGTMYWHLVAVAPALQGQGVGRRALRSLLRRHAGDGMRCVTTTVSARNIAMQNLCVGLGFRFHEPEMTFHLVRGSG